MSPLPDCTRLLVSRRIGGTSRARGIQLVAHRKRRAWRTCAVLCQECGKNDVCVQLTEIIDGEKTSRALCDTCAKSRGDILDLEVLTQAATEIQKLLVPGVLVRAGGSPGRSARCPRCGTTWAEFKKSSRLGCPHDYDVFESEVQRLLRRIHGADQHRGRSPDAALGRIRRERRLGELRRELEVAVKSEDYELAGQLRDQIRNLGGGEDGSGGAL